MKRLIDGVRRDLFEDRSEGHAWSKRLHRVVLERRMEAAGDTLNLDAVARRREARRGRRDAAKGERPAAHGSAAVERETRDAQEFKTAEDSTSRCSTAKGE